jgi:exopolysaccharide biosynthesis polyprenyl glycosylphosphotransferase
MFKKYPFYKKILCLVDLLVIVISAELAITLSSSSVPGFQLLRSEFIFLCFTSLIYIYIFHRNQLYKLNIIATKRQQIVLLTKANFYGVPLFLMVGFFANIVLDKNIYRLLLFYFPIFFCFSVFFRLVLIRKLYRRLIKKGYLKKHVLIVGAGEAGMMLAAQIENSSELGFSVAGFADDDSGKQNIRILNKPVLGTISDINDSLLAENKIKRIFIAINFITYERLMSIIKSLRKFNVPISLVTKHFNIIDEKLNVSWFDNLSYANFNYFSSAQAAYPAFKRFFDLAVSSVLLVVFFPLFLAIAAAIKFTSQGPFFYKPTMVGKGGKRFTMYKFRSMYHDADHAPHKELLKEIIANGEKKAGKLKNDRRITGIGSFLRKYSLDELPQLFNVFKGEMSLVGPRPCIAYELEAYKKWHKLRLSVRPGITGLWQVHGRSNVSFNDMVIMDIYYIRNRSFWLDYSILLKTFRVVFSGFGGA